LDLLRLRSGMDLAVMKGVFRFNAAG